VLVEAAEIAYTTWNWRKSTRSHRFSR